MKKLMSPIAIVFSLFLALPAEGAAPDLPSSHPFYEEMSYMLKKDVLTGYPDGTVRPDSKVSRAEAAVMIGRLKGHAGTKKETFFSDVPAEHFASGYIAEAVEAGYLNGYPDGTFRPHKLIARGEMALITERVFDLGFIYFHDIKDVPDSSRYYDAVCRLVAANIAIGYPDGTFRPYLEMSRGQFSAFFARAIEPEFKNKETIAHSYQRDKTKTYTYRTENGGVMVDRFIKAASVERAAEEFAWESRIGEDRFLELEYETYRAFAIGYPYSEYSTHLVYPIQAGKKFTAGYNPDPVIYTISGTNKTVETEYKTFTNAVEVTTPDGGKYYMVEGHAVVKWIKGDGTIYTELMKVK